MLLTDEWRDKMLKFAVLNLSSTEDAEDVVQDCFEAVLKFDETKPQPLNVNAYVFGILKNKIKDKLRVRYTLVFNTAEVNDELDNLLFNENGAWHSDMALPRWESMEDEHQQNVFFDVLDVCINDLPVKLGSVFSMKHFLDCPTDEILHTLEISKDDYWQCMSRAKKRIMYCLNQRWYEAESI